MTAVMVQGCTSWAGKSLLTTALCRWYARQGRRVAPYKSQNMSNNARVVAPRPDLGVPGGEIGTAQWLQALAAGVEPDVRMNPVLLKPEAGGSQVVRLGRVDAALSATPWRQRSQALWPTMANALHALLDSHDLVVIEGAGSPAEINLAANDIVNMRVAEEADAPVLLVADINRGGAFAHLYGTWSLLPESQQRRIVGFVLNRFRGDASLLPPGPEQLQRLTGVPTVAVVPQVDHDLPDEDGADLHRAAPDGAPVVAIVRYPYASNLDEFTLLERVASVRWAGRPSDLDGADLVVLPGSKHTAVALAWLADTGLDKAVAAAADDGTRVLGICGGLQLLGRELADPEGVDGSGPGLGLLDVTTRFARDKRLEVATATVVDDVPSPWAALAGLRVPGYEIRHGETTGSGDAGALMDGGLGWAHGNVAGWYLHGALEQPAVLEALFGTRVTDTLDHTFDRLADLVEATFDTDLLHAIGAPA